MHLDLILTILAIVTAAAMVYGPLFVYASDFCFDDRSTMAYLAPGGYHGGSTSLGLWRSALTEGLRRPWVSGRYLWYGLQRALYRCVGPRRRAWLAVGVVGHMGNAALLYTLARVLGLEPLRATIGAVLFTVHPMAVMGAALVGGLPSVLGMTCLLAGAIAVTAHWWLAVLVVGIVAINLKLDGWLYWPVIGGVWLLSR